MHAAICNLSFVLRILVECHLSVSSFREFLIIFNCRWRWQTVDKVVQPGLENVTRVECNLFLMRQKKCFFFDQLFTKKLFQMLQFHPNPCRKPHIYANAAKSRTIFVFVLYPGMIDDFQIFKHITQ